MEIFKVLVVRVDEIGVRPLEPVPPLLQDSFYSQQLLVSRVVVLLGWGEFTIN